MTQGELTWTKKEHWKRGKALKFYASVRLDVCQAEFDIVFSKGISRSGGILGMTIELGLADKSGSWFPYGGTWIGQGREGAKRFLKDNPDVAASALAA